MTIQPTPISPAEELAILRHDIKALKDNHTALKLALENTIDVLERAEADLMSRS